MWSAIRWLVLRFAALRWLFKLGGLAFLLPIALFLKSIGLPLLIVLAVLAIPVLLLLLLFGLPIFLVMIFGSVVMGILGFVLSLGLAAVKIGLFVVLPIWVMWMIGSRVYTWSCKRGGDSGGTGPSTSKPDTPDPASDYPGTGPADGIDPS